MKFIKKITKLTQDRLVIIHNEEKKISEKPLRELTAIEMATFIVENRFGKIRPLMSVTAPVIFHDIKPTLVLLNNGNERLLSNFKKGVQDFKNFHRLYADFHIDVTDSGILQFVKFAGIKKEDLPVVVYLPFTQTQQKVLPKFKTQKITKRAISKMVSEANEGKIEPYRKSSRYGDNIRVNIYTSVSLENFETVIQNGPKYFILGVDFINEYTPVTMRKIFKKLSEKVITGKLNSKLEFGICDVMENEIGEKFEIKAVPSIVLFVDGDLTNPKTYDGVYTEENVVKWVNENTNILIDGIDPEDL